MCGSRKDASGSSRLSGGSLKIGGLDLADGFGDSKKFWNAEDLALGKVPGLC